MTDGLGRKIDFKNTILIMTSNIGARQLADFGTGVGFGTQAQQESKDENVKSVIQNALRKAFSPEFLNRIDDMIMFKSLGRKEIHRIIDIELANLYARILSLGFDIKLTEKAKEFIVDQGYDEKFGARPLKRAIQKYIEDPLAEEIIKSNFKDGEKITMDLNTTKDGLAVKKKSKGSKKESSNGKDN
jgi:ATP-dependent Clp protease ATP-binding subunit ClpC